MKYIKTITTKNGYVRASVLEKTPPVKNILGEPIALNRFIAQKEFGNSFINKISERKAEKVAILLDKANFWADNYIYKIKDKEFKDEEIK